MNYLKSGAKAKGAISILTVSLLLGASKPVLSDATMQSTMQQWQPLSEIVSPAQLGDIIRENADDSVDKTAIARSATGYQQGDFIAITFNNQVFCGRGGCWVFGYQPSTEETVFRTLVATRIPPNGPIVELIDSGLAFPCVRWFAYDAIPLTEPVETTACYREGDWEPAS